MIEHVGPLLRTGDNFMLYIQQNYFAFWGGVDIFFAISGFVIMRSIADRMGRNVLANLSWQRSELFAFWIRRAYRLLPSAWLWIAITMIVSIATAGHLAGNPSAVMKDAIASLLEVQNFHDYFCNIGMSECAGLSHYWSLSLEEQFYLVFPLLLIFVPARLLNFALVALIVSQIFVWRPANYTSLAWFVRTDALAWGVLLARFSISPAYRIIEPTFLRFFAFRSTFIFACLITIAGISFMTRIIASGGVWYPSIIALSSTLLVFSASYDRGYISSNVRVRSMLAWVGERSYALYLSHSLCFNGTALALNWTRPSFLTAAILLTTGICTTVIVADLNFRFIERPLTRRGRNIASKFLEQQPNSTRNHRNPVSQTT